MTCIITGAVAFNGHAWVGGDLHLIGAAYVFNACINRQSGAAWATREYFAHYTKEIDFSEAKDYWERRGTLVAPMAECKLNEAAQAYLRGPHAGLVSQPRGDEKPLAASPTLTYDRAYEIGQATCLSSAKVFEVAAHLGAGMVGGNHEG